jgi:methyl-accepting chemotaxis protein
MNLSLRTKLFGLAGLLLALMTVVGVVGILNLGSVSEKGGSMYADRVVPVRDLAQARSLLGDIDSQILRSFGTTAPDSGLVTVANRDRDGVNALIKTYEATYLVDAEKRGLTAFHDHWDAYTGVYQQVQALAEAGKDEQASALYLAQAAPLYAKVDADLATLISVNDKVARALNNEIHATGQRGRTVTLLLLALAFALGTGAAFVVARGIVRGVGQMLEAAKGIAAGDVDQRVDVRSRDEIGEMAVAFEQMIDYLGEMSRAGSSAAWARCSRPPRASPRAMSTSASTSAPATRSARWPSPSSR